MAFTPARASAAIASRSTRPTWPGRCGDVATSSGILEQAQDVNAHMPGCVAARIGEALNERAKPLKGAWVLVLGVAYKPDVGDVRESPSLRVMQALARRGAKLTFHDPFVDAVTVDGRRLARTELTARAVTRADLVALLTPQAATTSTGSPRAPSCCSTPATPSGPAVSRTTCGCTSSTASPSRQPPQEVRPIVANPQVTIVIPSRDRQELLQRAIASALAQRFGDLEVVVVDDGSREPVHVTHRDPRIRVFRNDQSVGVSAARNVGLEHARGRWITFLDDDDELLPDMVQASLAAAARSQLPLRWPSCPGWRSWTRTARCARCCRRSPSPAARPCAPRGAQGAHVHQANSLFAPVDVLRLIGGWTRSSRRGRTTTCSCG